MTRRRRGLLGRACMLVAATALSSPGVLVPATAGAAGLTPELQRPTCSWPMSSAQVSKFVGVQVHPEVGYADKPIPVTVGGRKAG